MINGMATSVTGERNQTLYKTAKVDDLDIFYREAGPEMRQQSFFCMGSQLHRTCLEIL